MRFIVIRRPGRTGFQIRLTHDHACHLFLSLSSRYVSIIMKTLK
ncbi:hypothetical protein KNP414_02171 [Paenibacillus mucilaginosus KNP414]|uniref:Uncharacterized protein n=1 Tax=Paenibacillus mucilaginosus (strain KNP414) TaxID=1036673 RepID=F8F502_PAEMK|nr:hypothetical protein KNP414_02171 [Paenibacillus mucilaginosus KNP414]